MLKNIEGKKKQLKTIHFKEKDMIDNLGKKQLKAISEQEKQLRKQRVKKEF